MSLEPVLIDGAWRQADTPAGEFSAIDPATRTASRETYPVSSFNDVARACRAAGEAVAALRAVSIRLPNVSITPLDWPVVPEV